jgi:hypothetical protein
MSQFRRQAGQEKNGEKLVGARRWTSVLGNNLHAASGADCTHTVKGLS